MSREVKLYTIAIGALLAFAALLFGTSLVHGQSGGFPSFPFFQGVAVGNTGGGAAQGQVLIQANTQAGINVTGNSAVFAEIVGGYNGTNSYGLKIQDGSTSSDIPFQVTNEAASSTYFEVFGDGGSTIGGASSLGQGTLNVTELSTDANPAVQITSGTSAGSEIGLKIIAGAVAADQPLIVVNHANSVAFMCVWGDGGVSIPCITDEGYGSINVQNGYYVNGIKQFQSGSFALSDTTDCTGLSGTVYWAIAGNVVTVDLPSANCTSTATTFTISSWPAAITPAHQKETPGFAGWADNGVATFGATCFVTTTNTFICDKMTAAAPWTPVSWTAAGTKGMQQASFSYTLQ